MSWIKYSILTLNVNKNNAIGSNEFNGNGEILKFVPGKYKICYDNGGIISQNLDNENLKINKYVDYTDRGGLIFGNYTPAFFKEQKRYVWQCIYGTLPGFSESGFDDLNILNNLSNNELLFNIIRPTSLNFWYNDDCVTSKHSFKYGARFFEKSTIT